MYSESYSRYQLRETMYDSRDLVAGASRARNYVTAAGRDDSSRAPGVAGKAPSWNYTISTMRITAAVGDPAAATIQYVAGVAN